MKNICFVNPSSVFGTIGGAEVQIYILANEAAKRGWNVHYVTSPDEIPADNKSDIHFIPFEKPENPDKNLEVFHKTLEKINPDCIYQRGRKMWTYYTGSYAKKTKTKFIFSSSMDIDCYKHKYLFRTVNNLRDIYVRVKQLKHNYILDKQTLYGMKCADLVLSQSNTQKELLLNNLNIQSVTFPNLHPESQCESEKNNDKPLVLWIARLRTWKQPEIFMKLARSCRDLNCEFIMAGRMSDHDYSPQIERTEKEVENFRYLGGISFEESNELFCRSSLFINTSKPQEGFPNTFIQAWLRKVPVITLNFDPDNLIERNRLGAVASNFNNLVQNTRSFIMNASMRQQTGYRTFEYATKNHGVSSNIDTFFKLINEHQTKKS